MSVDLVGAMATWIASNSHRRPFYRDAGFVAAFGRPGPAALRAAVDEMKRRALIKVKALEVGATAKRSFPAENYDGRR